MTNVHITATGLSKCYRVADKTPGLMGTIRHFVARQTKDVHAVQDVSFTIERGEIVGFLGANGAGKTTTLKMLAGLIHPTSGEARVGGDIPFQRRRDFLRQITLVMGQKQQLIWDLPTLDSLRINAALYEIPDDERDRRIGDISEMLDLGAKLKTPVRKLSLGERMKAELLAALLHRPEVLFLDEPTLGLDINAQVTMRAFLRDYNERFGATVLLTSHYMADITALCERVLVIHAGRLAYDGSLRDLGRRVSDVRRVQIELREEMPRETLEQIGPLAVLEGRIARFDVERAELTQVLPRLLEKLPVADLSISDPPIDDIIGDIFRGETFSTEDGAEGEGILVDDPAANSGAK